MMMLLPRDAAARFMPLYFASAADYAMMPMMPMPR